MAVSALSETMLPGVRWAILRTIEAGGYQGATETMCRDVITAEYLGATKRDVRNQLHYLATRKLISIERSEIYPWRATLTRHGHDVVEYQVACEAGIRRPQRLAE